MSDEQKKNALFAAIAFAVLMGGILLWAGADIRLVKQSSEFKASLFGAGVLLLALALLAIAYFWLKTAQRSSITSEESASPVLDRIESKTLRSIVIGAGVLVVLTFGWAGTYVYWKQESSEVALPIVIIAGVTVLLLVLGLLTFVFSVLKLSNKDEALALPSGSVRAVIALMLLVIFAIVAIFLYSDVSTSGKLQKIEHVTSTQEIELRKQLDIVVVVPEMKANPDSKVEEKTGSSTVWYRGASRAAEDLAKQLIVLLGTLVTAVSSFYFGSSSIAAVTKSPKNIGGPNAKAVNPGNLKPDTAEQSLKITGTNLDHVVSVKLTSGKESIVADGVAASDTSVDCTVTTKADTEFGPWTVVVSDNANNDSRIPDGVTVGTKPAQAEPAPAAKETANPEITDIDRASLKADGSDRAVKVSGKNLADVDKVKFVPDTGITVGAVTPSSSGNELTFNVKIESATPPDRDVSLLNKAGTESKPVKITLGI